MLKQIDVARKAIDLVLSLEGQEIQAYLDSIAALVAELLRVDWTLITLAREGISHVLASTREPEQRVMAVHGTVSECVIRDRRPLVVENASSPSAHGVLPPGFSAYLGVPMLGSDGAAMGTLCSFHESPRSFSDDEVKIAQSLIGAVARCIESQRARQKQHHLALLGGSTAMLVHELRSPLSVIVMELEALERRSPAEDVTLVKEEAGRLERLIKDVLVFSRPLELRRELLDPAAFVRASLPIPIHS